MDYQKIYTNIIERAKSRQLEGYIEKHHITPKCIGGNNDKENIVELTAREHFICHMLLVEIYPSQPKLLYSLFLMSINKNKKEYQKYKLSSRTYERIKKEWNIKVKGKSKPKGFGDKIKSLDRNKKIGDANRGKPKPKNFSENHRTKMLGKKKSESWKLMILNVLSKPMLQYDLNGKFIKEWLNATEVKNKLNINKCSVRACIRGKTKTAGGFIWVDKLKNNIDEKLKILQNKSKIKNNKIININGIKYNSINEASEKLNIPRYKLSYMIKNNKINFQYENKS